MRRVGPRSNPKRLPPKKPKKAKEKDRKDDPRIIELHNALTGETKWEVFRRGFSIDGFMLRQPFSEEFETREEAIACYAENFGWSSVGEFQPTRDDASYGYAKSEDEEIPDPTQYETR